MLFTLSWSDLLIVALVALAVFGTGRLSDLGDRRARRGDSVASPPVPAEPHPAEQP